MANVTVNIIPITQREKQVANSLGCDNWEIIETRDKVICHDNQAATLVRKNGHIRWIKSRQIVRKEPCDKPDWIAARKLFGGE